MHGPCLPTCATAQRVLEARAIIDAMMTGHGLTAEEAAPCLKLPRGKKLAYNGTELELVDVQEGRTQAQLTEFISEGLIKSRADRNWQDELKTAVIERQLTRYRRQS